MAPAEALDILPEGKHPMVMRTLSLADLRFVDLSFREAKTSLDAGGLPIGSVLARGDQLVASGHNRRVQHGDPIAHGEMDCLRKAGRQTTYRDTTVRPGVRYVYVVVAVDTADPQNVSGQSNRAEETARQ